MDWAKEGGQSFMAFEMLGDYITTPRTIHMKTIRMILPTANLRSLFRKNIPTPGTAIIVPTESPP